VTGGISQVFQVEADCLGNAWGGHQSPFDGRLILEGENPLGSEANLVTAGENRARAFRSRCQQHRKPNQGVM